MRLREGPSAQAREVKKRKPRAAKEKQSGPPTSAAAKSPAGERKLKSPAKPEAKSPVSAPFMPASPVAATKAKSPPVDAKKKKDKAEKPTKKTEQPAGKKAANPGKAATSPPTSPRAAAAGIAESVFAEECVKWLAVLPTREKQKLEKKLAKAKDDKARRSAFVESAEGDSTKTRASRRQSILDAAAALR